MVDDVHTRLFENETHSNRTTNPATSGDKKAPSCSWLVLIKKKTRIISAEISHYFLPQVPSPQHRLSPFLWTVPLPLLLRSKVPWLNERITK